MSAGSPLLLSPLLAQQLRGEEHLASQFRVFGACVVLPPGGRCGAGLGNSYFSDALEALGGSDGGGGDAPGCTLASLDDRYTAQASALQMAGVEPPSTLAAALRLALHACGGAPAAALETPAGLWACVKEVPLTITLLCPLRKITIAAESQYS
jgi:hypothetical protein